jgi:hypothetical protein
MPYQTGFFRKGQIYSPLDIQIWGWQHAAVCLGKDDRPVPFRDKCPVIAGLNDDDRAV